MEEPEPIEVIVIPDMEGPLTLSTAFQLRKECLAILEEARRNGIGADAAADSCFGVLSPCEFAKAWKCLREEFEENWLSNPRLRRALESGREAHAFGERRSFCSESQDP